MDALFTVINKVKLQTLIQFSIKDFRIEQPLLVILNVEKIQDKEIATQKVNQHILLQTQQNYAYR
ncbi:unnamed protein product [Paramecium octaurelia]|uniref:Uncharacterized protein n=1 Tax=Paramecium octaurelia TaxID=43137 RepID=A0A8S1U4X0_PAROT|nr:unnamed protein product [Paramecium octaurelia]